MDQQQLANLKQLAATIRMSTHILEQYPEQLYNQVAGRIGVAAYLKEMKPSAQPYLRLESRSLKRPDQAIVRILTGHSDRVTSCTFNHDGNLLVSASADLTLRLWDIQNGIFLRDYKGHSKTVTACAFSPDSRYILSASEDATLRLWDRDTTRTIHILRGHGQTVNACAFSPDGCYILSASGGNERQQGRTDTDNSLRWWNVKTGECEHIFVFPEELKDRICTCAISTDGLFALSGDADHKIHLWDLSTYQCIHTYWPSTGNILACIFLDNQFALTTSEENVMQLWNLKKDECIREFSGHKKDVTGCAAFTRTSPDDQEGDHPQSVNYYAISSSHDNTLRLWNLASGEGMHILSGHTDWVNGCAVNHTGTLAASASSDTTVILWDIDAILASTPSEEESSRERESWRSKRIFKGHSKDVDGCAFSPNGQFILSASGSKTLQLWDRTTGADVQTFSYGEWVRCCSYSPDGKHILGGYTDGKLVMWDVQTGREVQTFSSHEYDIWGCSFSSDGRHVLSASLDHTLRYWDVQSGTCIHTLTGHLDGVNACAISPDGKLGVSGSRDWSLRLWDLSTGDCLHVLEKELSGKYRGLLDVNACAFSPDGLFVISASDDETVSLWNVETGRLVRTYTGHAKAVTGCAFSPDGRFIASVSSDQSIRLWDVETAVCICTFRGHMGIIHSCAFSPDGKYILSESRDQTLRLWDVSAYQFRPPPSEGHHMPVRACRFSSDGRYALTASEDQTLRLWDVTTHQVKRILTGHTDVINDCAFNHDGTSALSASNDRSLRLWDVQSGECKKTFIGHAGVIWGCAFNPNGHQIISGSEDRWVVLWDIATGEPVKKFNNLARNLTRYSFTTDGRYILSASALRTLWLWDVTLAHQVPSYKGIVGPPLDEEVQRASTVFPASYGRNAVNTTISPNSMFALSTYPEGLFILWEVPTGRELYRNKNSSGFYISDVSFSPDERYLLMRTDEYLVRLYVASTGMEIAQWPADTKILCCAFSPDGRHVVAGDASGAVHFLVLEGVPFDIQANVPVVIKESLPTSPPPALEAKRRSILQFWKQKVRRTLINKEEPRISFFIHPDHNTHDPIDEIPLHLRRNLNGWIKAFQTIIGGRQYLENHLELLRDESEQYFTIIISKSGDDPKLVEKLRTARDLLHTSRIHNNTKAAIRDSFADEFGAFEVLDLPPFLNSLRMRLNRGVSVSDAIPLLRDAIARSQRDTAVAPEITASLQFMLAEILQEHANGDYSEVISLTSDALKIFTSERFPKRFAHTQELLGSSYFMQGGKHQELSDRENTDVQHAIECFKAALSVLSRETQPEDWGHTQMSLGMAYEVQGALRCATLHLTNALEVYASEEKPVPYYMIQEKLGELTIALMEREIKLEALKQSMDEDMIAGIRRQLESADEDCAGEL